MYTNIQQAITAVGSSASSIFTKEDVIKLLNNIDLESAAPKAEGIDVDELIHRVESLICNYDTSDLVNYEDVELSISYDHRVEIDNVNVDLDELNSDVTAAIYEFFKEK